MSPLPSFESRIAFVVELGRRLHEYGTSSQRLEAALQGVSDQLRMACQLWSNPTGMIVSFSDIGPQGDPTLEVSRIVRLPPGDNDLGRLVEADAIAEQVLNGEMDLDEGREALRALDQPESKRQRTLMVFACALIGACVAALLRAGVADMISAGVVGLLIGLLGDLAKRSQRFSESYEAVAAMLATVLAGLIGAFVWPISLQTVVIGAVVILLPGLTLTNAVNELASNHWVSGSARFAGAATVLMKLAFGAMVGDQLLALSGIEQLGSGIIKTSALVEWLALPLSGIAFGILFRAHLRDYPLVLISAGLGYSMTRFGGSVLGSEIGVFLGGFVISAVSNAYARWFNRPGAVLRLPGIILLVPGSVGFRSLSFMFERDFTLGFDTAITLLTVLVSLVAGLLFGNLLIASRRSL
ncbi:MAG: threonine/serine exporter family protein [Xanthomonadales bacterium]|nr:threonine/serine exporter family protein [Xanthomonadales bacterium]